MDLTEPSGYGGEAQQESGGRNGTRSPVRGVKVSSPFEESQMTISNDTFFVFRGKGKVVDAY